MSAEVKETMVTCDALDERDFLVQKINSAIADAQFVGSKRKKDGKVGAVSVDEFRKNAKSDWDSITDMIERFRRLNKAIIQANATEVVKLRSGMEMTRAEAIGLRNSLRGVGVSDMSGDLINHFDTQFDTATIEVKALDKKAADALEGYKNNMTSRDTNRKLDEDEVATCEKMADGLHGELVIADGLKESFDKFKENYETMVRELDSAIKVSNATTSIEF